ncbi:uncharacterized protein ALTATR162_LOCUS6198 [Alternaria atra]|uniref:Uncharacterized protein n=1 Tax=Alternaria atra TaxID=119953 RepID=A0A8J2I1E7_9PLEO|nr:uncharacterized protein ALTATR162_LOCUS6198 [Alternaria atra]CAG5162319.1 unnamed protein product [Alternaria atra]
MEGYALPRRALGAMPNTSEDIVFLAAAIVAFFSGALIVDWLRWIRDVSKQKQWHDMQMKALQEGFGSSHHFPRSFAAIQASLNVLHGKADDASDRVDDKSSRIDEIRQALDHIHKHQHQDFDFKTPSLVQSPDTAQLQDLRELLVAVRNIQDTLTSADHNISAAPCPFSTVVPTDEINLSYSGVRTLAIHSKLPLALDTSSAQTQTEAPGLSHSSVNLFAVEPGVSTVEAFASSAIQTKETEPLHSKLDQYVNRLQAELSDRQRQCDELNREKVTLESQLEVAEGITDRIGKNAKEAARQYWTQRLDDETRLNETQKENLQQAHGEINSLSKQRDELAHTNAELREEIERARKSAEDSKDDYETLVNKNERHEHTLRKDEEELEELRRVLGDQDFARKQLEKEIESQMSEIIDLKAGLSLADDERVKTEEKIKDLIKLHESAQLSEREKGAMIDELNERLTAEVTQITRISTERDILAKENESMNDQMQTLEKGKTGDKQEIDRLTNEIDAVDKQKQGLQQALEDCNQKIERQQEALDCNKKAREGSSDETDTVRQTIPPPKSVTLETTSDEEPTQEPETEDTAPVTMPMDTPGEEVPEQHSDANDGEEDGTEDMTSTAKVPVASSTGDGDQLVEKRSWADDDADEDFLVGEVEKFTAKTALLTLSPATPNTVSISTIPARLDPRSDFALDIGHTHYQTTQKKGHVNAMCTLCDKRVVLPFWKSGDERMNLDWDDHKSRDCITDAYQASVNTGNYTGNNRGGYCGRSRGPKIRKGRRRGKY